ncbi:MAG: molybdenum cofactor guanylyltransferase [Actinomycetota bacterium]|nr:molybdenum cofactor guanylyltransferase [Actinomycetota bacterium]
MAGLVLCGGASRRMGVDKATLSHPDGGTAVDGAARALVAAGARPVLVATGTAGRLGSLGYVEVDDGEEHRGAGPLAGILAGLRRSADDGYHLLAVLAVDLPNASPDLFRWLRERWRPADNALVALDSSGRPQPMHALYATSLVGQIDDQLRAGERRVLRLLDAVDARLLSTPFGDAWSWNRNTFGR